MKTIIILSEIDWSYLWQRHQIFACLYSEAGYRTYYVNRLGMRYPRLNEIGYVFKRLLSSFRSSSANSADTSVNILNPIFLPGNGCFVRFINRFFFIPLFKLKIKVCGELIFHVYQPTSTTLDILDSFSEKKVIYDCVQNFEKHPGRTDKTLYYESRLIKESDIMITDSFYLYEKHSKARQNIIKVSPGVDYEHFSRTFRGSEAETATNILYYGHVRDDLDFEIINSIAEMINVKLTIVGTIAESSVKKLSNRINIVAQQPYSMLPEFIREADVLLLPYVINDFTKAIIPAKFFECLATGKPIISTPLPDIEKLKDIINIVYTKDDAKSVIESIPKFESEDKRLLRQKIASENSWRSRFESFHREF